MSYIDWLNTLRNIGDNATLASKKNTLRAVSQQIINAGENAELKVRMVAQNVLFNLDNPLAEGNEAARVDWDLVTLKSALDNMIPPDQQQPVNMMVEDGGRRKRRKTKKSRRARRTTRRR